MRIFSHEDKINFIKRISIALVTLIVMVTATVAWFTVNRKLVGRGMQLAAEVGSSLVIAETPQGLDRETSIVLFDDDARNVDAATHNWDPVKIDEKKYENLTGLWYNTNPNAVNYKSGLSITAKEGEDPAAGLTFMPVPVEADGSSYFTDYTVYIAAVSAPVTVSDFICRLSLYNPASIDETDYRNAISIDFYLGEVSETNYRGTLNLAGLTWENTYTDDGKRRKERKEIDLAGDGTITFPVVSEGSESYALVTMRVYIDGGLRYLEESGDSTATKTYVHADGLTIRDFGVKVDFEAK